MVVLVPRSDYAKMFLLSRGFNKSRPFVSLLFSRSLSQNSTEQLEDQTVLVRDFIHSALYDSKLGYFASRPEAVGFLPEPLLFNSFKGRQAYINHVNTLYMQTDISWFTPVEIFKPWYGYAIAKYIRSAFNPTVPLHIYEIGGGAGTCAKNILDYMKLTSPNTIYNTMKYVSVEISRPLARKQTELVSEVESHKDHFHVECRSAVDGKGWGLTDMTPCFVIMLEVLDNLPHDLLYRETPGSPWMETHVLQTTNRLTEIHRPLKDSSIKQYISIIENDCENSLVPWYSMIKKWVLRQFPVRQRVWIPTICLQLLELLHVVRPNMNLIISDFSFLPDVKLEGQGAPLVASKKGGVTKDDTTYLDVKGDSDIFFPTDFQLLRKLDQHCSSIRLGKKKPNRHSFIMDSTEFLMQFADISKTRTRSGYNPMLEDYSNTKFYISGPTRLTPAAGK